MPKVSLFVILLCLCFSAFAQPSKREAMLEAFKFIEKSNWKEAEKLVLPFAENGDPEAQYFMSKILRIKLADLGRKQWRKLREESWSWYLKACKHDWVLYKNPSDEDSIRVQYVACLHNPDFDSPKNTPPKGALIIKPEKRMNIYRKAAEKNIYHAQLGYSYMLGDKGDSLESFKWLKIAADNNDIEALYDLGVKYLMSRGVKKDINKALEYLSKSLEGGWEEAAWTLACIYRDGKDVEQDLDKAIDYFNQSYELSSIYSQLKNFSLLQLGAIYTEKKEYQKALSKYQLIPEGTEIGRARFKMGEIYATLEQYSKAVYYLKKSDYEGAQKKLSEIRNR